jgi:group I intron endonuclease
VLSGIYALSFSGVQRYLGSSIDIQRRYKQHLNLLKRNAHGNRKLQSYYNKHGEPDLVIIEVVERATEKDVQELEQTYLDVLDFSEMCNLSEVAGGGYLSDEINDKRKASLKKFFANNPDAIRGKNNPFFGRKHTQETKDAIGNANRGLKRSEEWKEQKAADMRSRKGSFHSEEHKQQLKEKWSGGGNPAAQPIEHEGILYSSKKELMNAFGLTNYYQLSKFLNA